VLSLLLTFLPEECWLLLLQLAGLLIIVGARRTGFRLFGLVCLLAFAAPFLDSLLAALPPEVVNLLILIFPLLLISLVVRLIFGRDVWAQLVGRLLYDLLRAPFRFLGWLWRGSRRI